LGWSFEYDNIFFSIVDYSKSIVDHLMKTELLIIAKRQTKTRMRCIVHFSMSLKSFFY
jgi:hypothetical protein